LWLKKHLGEFIYFGKKSQKMKNNVKVFETIKLNKN
jgi:hypothetical protein